MSSLAVKHTFDIQTKVDLDFQFGFGSVVTAAVQTLIEIAVFRSDIKQLENAIADIYNHINKIYSLISELHRNQRVQRDVLFAIATEFHFSDRVEDYFYVLERLNGEKELSSAEFNLHVGTLIVNSRKLVSACKLLRTETLRRLAEVAPESNWDFFIENHGVELKSMKFDDRNSLHLACREYVRFVNLAYSNSVLALMNIPRMTSLSAGEKVTYIQEIKKSLVDSVISSFDIWEKWIRLDYLIWVDRATPKGLEDYDPMDEPGGGPIVDFLNVGFLTLSTGNVSITHKIDGISTSHADYRPAVKEIVLLLDELARTKREELVLLSESDLMLGTSD